MDGAGGRKSGESVNGDGGEEQDDEDLPPRLAKPVGVPGRMVELRNGEPGTPTGRPGTPSLEAQ
jgi:hypothetical protein